MINLIFAQVLTIISNLGSKAARKIADHRERSLLAYPYHYEKLSLRHILLFETERETTGFSFLAQQHPLDHIRTCSTVTYLAVTLARNFVSHWVSRYRLKEFSVLLNVTLTEITPEIYFMA